MKKFCVTYYYETIADVKVAAKTKKDAIEKVKEVLPDVTIDAAWEVKSDAMVRATW